MGGVQAASFYGGVFRVVQRGPLIELQLRGPKPACGTAAKTAAASAATKKAKKSKTAHPSSCGAAAAGEFRTRGPVQRGHGPRDDMAGRGQLPSTTTRVKRGVVMVRDFKRKRRILLRAGRRYVARRTPA